jgi:hypothetical protein
MSARLMILIGEGPSTSARLMLEPVTSNFSSLIGAFSFFSGVTAWAQTTLAPAEPASTQRRAAMVSFLMVVWLVGNCASGNGAGRR